jgi:predicted nucleotidyltransferase component of viral defense system
MTSLIESLLQRYTLETAQDYQNALKELIQEITLAGLSRAHFFDHAAFYGGTALRVFYNLPRFSEDLDFTLFKVQPEFKLSPYFKSVQETLRAFGFEVTIEELKKDKDRKIESAFLKANTKMHLIKVNTPIEITNRIQHNQVLNIKFEVDVYPPVGFECEVKTLFPPISASVKILKASSLFAGKLHAVLFRQWKTRVKGRDLYDLLWFLGHKIPVKLSFLEAKMRESGNWNLPQPLELADVTGLLIERLKALDWSLAKKDVLYFLKNQNELDSWSEEFFVIAIKDHLFAEL